MNRVALLCPVHRPKFSLFARFVESYARVQPDCDLYFVLGEDERPYLDEYRAHYRALPYLFAPRYDPNPSVISYKKFFGLNELHSLGRYEGIAAIDADSEFLTSGFHDSFDRFRSEMSLPAYPLEGLDEDPFRNVVRISCSYFPPTPGLEAYSQVYAWWNTLPWYVADHLPAFLESAGYFRNRFVGQSWYAYDQIVYHAWLMGEGLAKIHPSPILLEYPEMMRTKDLDNFADHKLDWLRYSSRKFPIFEGQRPLMYFHTDRV
jgi:hypothetical protein